MRVFDIHTDGSCRNAGGSGWAYLILNKGKTVFKESGRGDEKSTNNQMEIQAVIQALERMQSASIQESCAVVYSDSAYVVNCFKDNWIGSWKKNGWINSKRKPVANKKLWLELENLVGKYQVEFKHVRGGSTPQNKIVDKMAKKESRANL